MLYADYYKVGDGPINIDPDKAQKIIDNERDVDEKEKLKSFVDAHLYAYPKPYKPLDGAYISWEFRNISVSECYICEKTAVWLVGRIIWPIRQTTIPPNPDMPNDVLLEYEEAAQVLSVSSRAAAALLRLAVEKLCIYLGKAGTIDEMIAQLVSDGLSVQIQKALDVVRVIGNESVHPGTIDLRDDLETVTTLFKLVNLIVERLISEPRHIDDVFKSLPPSKLKGIEDRNRRVRDQK